VPQHVIQRGVDRQACFRAEADYTTYAFWLGEAASQYKVQIHAWVFMTNHVHLLMTPSSSKGVSRMMQQLGRGYVRYFNETHERTGTLWEGRYKSCLVESENYLLRCYRYIELNPVRAAMVNDPVQYKWSSHRCNGFGVKSKLITPHYEYLALGLAEGERLENYRSLFQSPADSESLNEIRAAVNSGVALGSEQFKKDVRNRGQSRL
jgi:putative transposase